MLKRIEKELYHYENGEKVAGPNANLSGCCSSLYGDCTELHGDCSGLRGCCSGLYGNCSGLYGDCTGLRGDCSGIYGDCSDLCGNCSDIYGNCTGLRGNINENVGEETSTAKERTMQSKPQAKERTMQVTKLERAMMNIVEENFAIGISTIEISAKYPNDKELEEWCDGIRGTLDTIFTQVERMVRYAQQHPRERFLTGADFANAIDKYGVDPYGAEAM